MRGSGVFWPLSLPVLVVLGLLLAVMAGLVQVGTLVYAYEHLGTRALVAVGSVAAVCLLLARPVKGVGIVLPGLVPPVVAAITALAISEPLAPALAYVAGVLGTLVGADLLNL